MKRKGLILLAAVIFLSGCSTWLRNKELTKVAKDWCMVIRASQVIPVYPLTEDLQVGDIFLVERTVKNQHKAYKKRGFLPLDNLIARLHPTGYDPFYSHSFFDVDANGRSNAILPKDWLKPGEETSWGPAPGAAFPTYSFSVKSGGGINVALPVQGVPVAMSLMGADAAEGTVTIGEAKTYGIDSISLYDDILKWELDEHDFLLSYAEKKKGKQCYIRVVSRIYLAGSVNVSIRSTKTGGATVKGGAPKPVELLTIDASKDVAAATTESYKASLKELNDSITEALKTVEQEGTDTLLPGGTLKVVAASSRAVSMEETFKRPLVIGYLGFDMAIGPDGMLGPPIPTLAVMTEEEEPQIRMSDPIRMKVLASYVKAFEFISDQAVKEDKEAQQLKKSLNVIGTLVPETYPVPILGDSEDPASKEPQPIFNVDAPNPGKSQPPELRDFTTYYDQIFGSLLVLEGLDDSSETKKKWLGKTKDVFAKLDLELKQHKRLLKSASEYVNNQFFGGE